MVKRSKSIWSVFFTKKKVSLFFGGAKRDQSALHGDMLWYRSSLQNNTRYVVVYFVAIVVIFSFLDSL